MADFFQNGCIATLQDLVHRPLESIEDELRVFARKKNSVLLLPALYSEFERPAMHRIIEKLKDVDYLYGIVLSLDKADKKKFKEVKEYMKGFKTPVSVVWHDGPRVSGMLHELQDRGYKIGEQGKGRSVWMAMGYILADSNVDSIALHDCDIVNYERQLLARLLYPVMNPSLEFEFSKGYYSRVSDKLYGRVTRTFYTPLIRSMKKMLGLNPFLEYLDSFRYALSGEFAFYTDLARGIRISPTWGLEVSLLSEVYQKTAVNRVCQVELMETYEHKHNDLSSDDAKKGLKRMAKEIAEALFRFLAQSGIAMSNAFFRSLLVTYMQEARMSIEKYHALAAINGIPYDRNSEIEAVETFTEALQLSRESFLNDPIGVPVLSAWARVQAGIPTFMERLNKEVMRDNEDI